MVDVIDKYDSVFREAGDEWDVDPILLKALAKHESGGDPNARGTSGEVGLGQFMPDTARRIGITNRSSPEQSIWGMAKLMNEALVAEHENSDAALRYYNGGAGWRSKRTDPKYPSYIGGQYKKYAAADTGSRTDATPAPAKTQTDEEFLNEQSKTYPGLAGPNADQKQGAPVATAAATNDDLLERMRKLSGAGSGGAPEAPAKSGSPAAPEPAAPAKDDLLERMRKLAPAPEPEPEKKAAPEDASKPGWLARNLGNLGLGLEQGVADVVHTANTFSAWVDKNVPALAELDKLTGLDPAKKAEAMEIARKAYEASEAGQSTAGTIGRFGGQAAATAPMLGPVGSAAGAGTNLLLQGAKGLAPWLLRTAGQGAVVGAGFGAAASGGSDAPVGEQVLAGAGAGAAAGPVMDVGARVIVPAARAIGRGIANNRGLIWTPGEAPPPVPPAAPKLSPLEQRVADVRQGNALAVGPDGMPLTAEGQAVSPGMGAPSSVGAAGTPRSAARMTEREIADNRWNAEQKYLTETQQPGVRDTNVYVKGNNPNEAQAEQTVHAARELKTAKGIDTVVAQEAREAADRANVNREIHYADVARSGFDHTAAVKARDDALEKNVAEVFANKGTADAQRIFDTGEAILDSPNGKLAPVERVVKDVQARLYNRKGVLETDPEQLWGVRKQINHLMSKEAALETPTNRAATRELMQMREAVDEAIEKAAPGFKAKVLEPYAQDSKAIDAMELLQGRESKLVDVHGRMQFSKVRMMLREATAARHPDAPINPWQSLTDEQMGKLRALDTDLRRSAAAEDLARAAGSDTVPNLADVAKAYGKLGVHSIPVLGPMVARGQAAFSPLAARRAAVKIQQRGLEMLNPDPAKYGPPNPLTPP